MSSMDRVSSFHGCVYWMAPAPTTTQINARHGLLLLHVAVVRHHDCQQAERADGRVAHDRERVEQSFG